MTTIARNWIICAATAAAMFAAPAATAEEKDKPAAPQTPTAASTVAPVAPAQSPIPQGMGYDSDAGGYQCSGGEAKTS